MGSGSFLSEMPSVRLPAQRATLLPPWPRPGLTLPELSEGLVQVVMTGGNNTLNQTGAEVLRALYGVVREVRVRRAAWHELVTNQPEGYQTAVCSPAWRATSWPACDVNGRPHIKRRFSRSTSDLHCRPLPRCWSRCTPLPTSG